MAAILIVTGPSRGCYVPLRQRSVVAGRSEACDLQVVDHAVSRRHVEILLDDAGAGFMVRDLHSTNGVRLNGELVTGERELVHGDVIEMGLSKLLFTEREMLDRDGLLEAFKQRGHGGRGTAVYPFPLAAIAEHEARVEAMKRGRHRRRSA